MAHVPGDLRGVAAVLLTAESGGGNGVTLDISGRIAAHAVHQGCRCGKMDAEAFLIVKQEIFGKILSRWGRPRLEIVNRMILKFFLDKVGSFCKCFGSMFLAERVQAFQAVRIFQVAFRRNPVFRSQVIPMAVHIGHAVRRRMVHGSFRPGIQGQGQPGAGVRLKMGQCIQIRKFGCADSHGSLGSADTESFGIFQAVFGGRL